MGILTWGLACGVVAATEAYEDHVECTGWAAALRLALRIRAGATLVGALVMTAGLAVPLLAGLNFIILPDFWAGMISVNVGQGLSRVLWGTMAQGDQAFGVIYGLRKVRRQGIVVADG